MDVAAAHGDIASPRIPQLPSEARAGIGMRDVARQWQHRPRRAGRLGVVHLLALVCHVGLQQRWKGTVGMADSLSTLQQRCPDQVATGAPTKRDRKRGSVHQRSTSRVAPRHPGMLCLTQPASRCTGCVPESCHCQDGVTAPAGTRVARGHLCNFQDVQLMKRLHRVSLGPGFFK